MMRMSTRCVAVAADPLDREVLNGPQQLGLRRQRQVRHFVEKQRAAVGGFELAAAAADAGRRAFLDAEQLRLEQRLDERRAVDGDERPVSAPAQIVNLPRDQLLADAALAFEQHGEVGRRRRVRSVVRSVCIAGVDPMSGAAPSRVAVPPSAARPARAGARRARSRAPARRGARPVHSI